MGGLELWGRERLSKIEDCCCCEGEVVDENSCGVAGWNGGYREVCMLQDGTADMEAKIL